MTSTPSDSDSDDNSEESEISKVLTKGSLVAVEVCQIPQQSEFASWSLESREVLLQAVLAAAGTAA